MSVKELRISDKSKQTLEGEEGKDFFSLTIQIESWSYDIDLSKEELDELKDNYFAEVKPRKAEPAKSQGKEEPVKATKSKGKDTPRSTIYTRLGITDPEKETLKAWAIANDKWPGKRPTDDLVREWDKAGRPSE